MRSKLAGIGLSGLALLMSAAIPAGAVSVRSWSASTAEQFRDGTLDGTALDEEGRVQLAPTLETLWGPEEGIVWSVSPSGESGGFVGLSGPARLVRVEPGRDPEVWFTFGEDRLITAVADDGAGGVFFGVSPEGLVYHARTPGDVETKWDTGSKFVWALAVDDDGGLWVGTGIPGALQRPAGDQRLETVFASGDDPVRCLAPLPGGGLVVGTGGRGRVIRFAGDARAFVLFDAEETEVVALAASGDGMIFALTAGGAKQVERPQARPPQRTADNSVSVVATPPSPTSPSDDKPADKPKPKPAPRLKVHEGGALYRLAPDGGSRKIWGTTDEMPFALVEATDGTLLVATGDAGRIYRLDREGRAAKLLRIPSEQASAMARTTTGRILIGGTTDARLERLGPEIRKSGSYLTPVIDAGATADWGRVQWQVEQHRGARIQFRVRAGNTAEPDPTWSDWQLVDEVSESAVPPARWFQIGMDMTSGKAGSPLLDSIQVYYLPHNRPPVIASLGVELPGVVWAHGPVTSSNRAGPVVADDPVARQTAAGLRGNRAPKSSIRRSYEAGVRTFAWAVEDPDGDRLQYSLEIRRAGSSDWSTLARNIDEKFFSWDARGMPDGLYRVRLTANDVRDNPSAKQLSHQRISDTFLIDNTRPSVSSVKIRRSGESYSVDFVATDPGGSIAAVEVALDGGTWEPIAPLDGVADSPKERYRLQIDSADLSPLNEPSVMVRVSDAAGNLGGDLWKLTEREQQP